MMLLSEKERTKHRFAANNNSSCSIVEDEEEEDDDCNKGKGIIRRRNAESSSSSSQHNVIQMQNFQSPVLAQKVVSSLREDILSHCKNAEKNLLPPYTPFSLSEEDNMKSLIHEMKMQCPSLCQDEKRQELVFMLLSNLDSS